MRKVKGSNQHVDKYARVTVMPRKGTIILYAILTLIALNIIVWGYNYQQHINLYKTKLISPLGLGIPKVYASESKPFSKYNHPDAIYAIWTLESTRGTAKDPKALNNYCKAQGKSNEFGYGGMALKICFDTFEESVKKVDAWLDKRDLENYCFYAKGDRHPCDYAERAKKLLSLIK